MHKQCFQLVFFKLNTIETLIKSFIHSFIHPFIHNNRIINKVSNTNKICENYALMVKPITSTPIDNST